MIDTSFLNNVRSVRPFLGLLLVGSVAFGFAFMIYKAVAELSASLYTVMPSDLEATKNVLHLTTKGDVQYGDTVSYTSTLPNKREKSSNQYINTVCFQGETMVFEKSTEKSTAVYLYDEALSDVEWNGKDAICSATLLERVSVAETTLVHLIDSVSFVVKARKY